MQILALGRPGTDAAALYGGKAAQLSRLASRGFAVPPGICVPAALAHDERAIANAAAALKPPFAVRSSALVEDAATASFAGQFETILDVAPADVPAAVRRVASGAGRASVRAYSAAKGATDGAVAVLVQEMVPAEIAGVLFTANPVTHNLGEMVANFARGRGDAVVGGTVRPESVTLDRARQAPDAMLEELRRVGLAIERELGGPADIEWAWARGRLLVLQARPITNIVRLPARPVEYARTYVWTHINFAETMPRPVTPLGWSLMEFGATHAMMRPFRFVNRVDYRPFEMLFGRVYWNITALFGSRWLFRQVCDAIQLIDPNVGADFEAVFDSVRPAPVFSAGQKLLLLAQAGLFLPAKAALLLHAMIRRGALRRRLDRFEASLRSRVPAPARSWRDDALRTRDYLRDATLDMRRLYLPAFHASMVALDLFLRAARRFLRIPMVEAVSLIVPDEPSLTMQADLALRDLARRGSDDVSEFLARFGHRGPGEQDIVHPRYAEDPRLVRELVRRLPASAPESLDARRAKADALFRENLARAPAIVRPALPLLLRLARAFYAFRENGKHYLTLIFHLVKPAFLRIGRALHAEGRLASPDDVFFLTADEIFRGDVDPARIRERRDDHARYRDVRAPLVITSRGVPSRPAPAAADGVLRGDGVSPGTATGRVRVVVDPSRDEPPQPGEILVVPLTDPGWTPLFLNAAALVTEVGGMLSHGAVVARELGLPAVVNVRDATRLLRTGQTVTVDGARGEVTPERTGSGATAGST